ncbi:pirin family protein [Archangium gephyra]|nr:pirin family protein [Archangium gephyra]
MSYRSIASAGGARKRLGSYEFSAANVSAESVGRDIDPVIAIDHFHIRAPTFAPHPHAGFSAVTYLFEDGEGEFINRDSLGDRIVARPGAVIWTVTGSGVLHEEFPRVRGTLSHGLQVFVNLAAAEKMQAPHVLFVDGPDVPVFERAGARVRVMAGTSGDVRGKLAPPGDVTFLDVKLEPGAAFEQAFPADRSVLAYVIDGGVLVGGETRRLGALEAASFAADGDSVLLRATAEGAHVVLIAGRPLREPVIQYGPFVMNSEEQIASAIERYRAGRMGRLAPTTDI